MSQEVHELYDGEDHVFDLRGPFELKGFDEPIPLYEVTWRTPA